MISLRTRFKRLRFWVMKFCKSLFCHDFLALFLQFQLSAISYQQRTEIPRPPRRTPTPARATPARAGGPGLGISPAGSPPQRAQNRRVPGTPGSRFAHARKTAQVARSPGHQISKSQNHEITESEGCICTRRYFCGLHKPRVSGDLGMGWRKRMDAQKTSSESTALAGIPVKPG